MFTPSQGGASLGDNDWVTVTAVVMSQLDMDRNTSTFDPGNVYTDVYT